MTRRSFFALIAAAFGVRRLPKPEPKGIILRRVTFYDPGTMKETFVRWDAIGSLSVPIEYKVRIAS